MVDVKKRSAAIATVTRVVRGAVGVWGVYAVGMAVISTQPELYAGLVEATAAAGPKFRADPWPLLWFFRALQCIYLVYALGRFELLMRTWAAGDVFTTASTRLVQQLGVLWFVWELVSFTQDHGLSLFISPSSVVLVTLLELVASILNQGHQLQDDLDGVI